MQHSYLVDQLLEALGFLGRDARKRFDAFNAKLLESGLRPNDKNHLLLKRFDYILQKSNNTFASAQTLQSLRVTVRSILQLCEFLWGENYDYVLTAKFNQDPLERHFGIIRGMLSYDHPTVVDFMQIHLLQTNYIPVKGVLLKFANCENATDESLTQFTSYIRELSAEQIKKCKLKRDYVYKNIKKN